MRGIVKGRPQGWRDKSSAMYTRCSWRRETRACRGTGLELLRSAAAHIEEAEDEDSEGSPERVRIAACPHHQVFPEGTTGFSHLGDSVVHAAAVAIKEGRLVLRRSHQSSFSGTTCTAASGTALRNLLSVDPRRSTSQRDRAL
jgi:hypothetical protein